MDSTPITDPGVFDGWRWPNFRPDEFRCRETGQYLIVPAFMDRLQALRAHLGFPFVVTSGYRAPEHSVECAKATPGAHASGRAVDIAVAGEQAFQLVAAAAAYGFTGIGVSQRAGRSRFIHLDDVGPGFHAARPALWSY